MAVLPIELTTYGLTQLAGGTFAPDRIVLGDGIPGAPHDQFTTALTNILKTLTSPGDVVQFSAQQVGDDVRLHVVSFDDTSDEYTLREFALADATGLLAVYGEGLDVAVKGVAALHFEFDMTLANAAPGDVVIGPTAYLLPTATEGQTGVVQLATVDEVDAGGATDRAVTPVGAHAALDLICASNWRREASGLPSEDVFALAHDGDRRWLAVGDNGLIATSDDMGETWTARTPAGGFSGRFRGAHFAAGLFVIVGQGAEVQTSPDGVTWTNRHTSAGPELYGVTYDGTGWVAVGSSGGGAGYVITAAAAATSWTVRTAPSFSTLLYACASDGAGVVVAVGDRDSTTLGQVSVSTDQGVTWSSEEAPALVGTLRAVTHAGGAFYAGGEGSDIISSAAPTGAPSSSDWTVLRSASEAAAIYGIASPGGGCVVATRGGATADPADPLIGHSTTWRIAPTPGAEGAFCAHVAKGLVLLGLDGGGVLRSLVFGHRL